MFGIFVFHSDAKFYGKDHPLKKKPQEALSLSNEEIVHLARNSSNIAAYLLHWADDMDKETFEKCYEAYKDKLPEINGIFKKSKQGFVDENKEYYCRFIIGTEKWFKENLGQE